MHSPIFKIFVINDISLSDYDKSRIEPLLHYLEEYLNYHCGYPIQWETITLPQKTRIHSPLENLPHYKYAHIFLLGSNSLNHTQTKEYIHTLYKIDSARHPLMIVSLQYAIGYRSQKEKHPLSSFLEEKHIIDLRKGRFSKDIVQLYKNEIQFAAKNIIQHMSLLSIEWLKSILAPLQQSQLDSSKKIPNLTINTDSYNIPYKDLQKKTHKKKAALNIKINIHQDKNTPLNITTKNFILKNPSQIKAPPPITHKSQKKIRYIIPPRNYFVVSQTEKEDFSSITQAIETCPENSIIHVRKGIYKEPIFINKSITIKGEGNRKEIILRVQNNNALTIRSTDNKVKITISNLSIEQASGHDWYGIDIASCNPIIENCDISCAASSCIAIHQGANPTINNNKIHYSKDGSGIYIFNKAQGIITHNTIENNHNAGIEICDFSNPEVMNNTIQNGSGGGILLYNHAEGVISYNTISNHALANIQIESFSNPHIHNNMIYNGEQGGIFIKDNGTGIIEHNEITHNKYAGIAIESFAKPHIYKNRIQFNGYTGIWIYKEGLAYVESNDLRFNHRGAWDIENDGYIQRKNNITDN